MASWLQAQLKAAEGLLEAVDRSVSKTAVTYNGTPDDLETIGGNDRLLSNTEAHSNVDFKYGETVRAPGIKVPYDVPALHQGPPISRMALPVRPLGDGKSSIHTARAPNLSAFGIPNDDLKPDHSRQHDSRPLSNGVNASASHGTNGHTGLSVPEVPERHSRPEAGASSDVNHPPAHLVPESVHQARLEEASTTSVPPNTAPPERQALPGSASNSISPLQSVAHSPAPIATPAVMGASPSSSKGSAAAEGTSTFVPSQNHASSSVPDAVASASNPDASSGLREAQLSRLVEQLRKRLDTVKLENQQLEEMLQGAESRVIEEQKKVARLSEDLAAGSQGEAHATSQLAAMTLAHQELMSKYDTAQKQVLRLEASVSTLEDKLRSSAAAQGTLEGAMVAALRQQLAGAEARLEQEFRAHQHTKSSCAAREAELTSRCVASDVSLADMTRAMQDNDRKYRDLEDQHAVLQAAYADLSQQLASTSSAATAAQAASASPLEVEALRRELKTQRGAAAAAESARVSAESALASLTRELDQLRHAVHSSQHAVETSGLEAQVREASDMLFLKQTQLEKLASDKAATTLRLEAELSGARAEAGRLASQLRRYEEVARQPGGMALSGHEVIPMDALGEPYQRLARHNRVGKAVKAAANFLDTTASTTSFLLRQYPLVRVLVFVYIVFVHLYLYYLTAKMQRQVLRNESASFGLN